VALGRFGTLKSKPTIFTTADGGFVSHSKEVSHYNYEQLDYNKKKHETIQFQTEPVAVTVAAQASRIGKRNQTAKW